MWIRSREYTGRIVTVTNAKIFDEPEFNYTHEFPFIWEELIVPIAYTATRLRTEEVLLQTAAEHTVSSEQLSADVLASCRGR